MGIIDLKESGRYIDFRKIEPYVAYVRKEEK